MSRPNPLAAAPEIPLDRLAREVRSHHEQAQAAWESAVEHAYRCGELLIEAKAQCKHGEWLPWLAKVGIPTRSAQNYMRVAKYADRSHLPATISEALDALDPEARARRARLRKIAEQIGVHRERHPQEVDAAWDRALREHPRWAWDRVGSVIYDALEAGTAMPDDLAERLRELVDAVDERRALERLLAPRRRLEEVRDVAA